jgi:hypothetical protein
VWSYGIDTRCISAGSLPHPALSTLLERHSMKRRNAGLISNSRCGRGYGSFANIPIRPYAEPTLTLFSHISSASSGISEPKRAKNFGTFNKSLKTGAPEEIRTPDPQIRSLVLYPAELRARRVLAIGFAAYWQAPAAAAGRPGLPRKVHGEPALSPPESLPV